MRSQCAPQPRNDASITFVIVGEFCTKSDPRHTLSCCLHQRRESFTVLGIVRCLFMLCLLGSIVCRAMPARSAYGLLHPWQWKSLQPCGLIIVDKSWLLSKDCLVLWKLDLLELGTVALVERPLPQVSWDRLQWIPVLVLVWGLIFDCLSGDLIV